MNELYEADATAYPEESWNISGNRAARRHAEAPVLWAGTCPTELSGLLSDYLAFLGMISTDLAKVGGSIRARAWDIAPLKSQPKIFLSLFLLIF